MSSDGQPWDRAGSETQESFEAFVLYRDMGASRTTGRVGRALAKSRTLMEGWCNRHCWVARAAAYDAECDRLKQIANRRAIEKMARRHAKIARDMLERAAEAMESIQFIEPADIPRWIKVAAELERTSLGADIQRVEVTGKGGAPIEFAYLEQLDDKALLAMVHDAIDVLQTTPLQLTGDVNESTEDNED